MEQIKQIMKWAKGVSIKDKVWDDDGNQSPLDFERMMRIVVDAGYHGYVGIEYEGGGLDEYAGIKATKKLLENVRSELAKS